MKAIKTKISILLTALGIGFLISLPTNAAFRGPDMTPQYNTVQDVLTNPVDDTKVVLEGYITGKTSHERYIFKDGTGQITVEIDDKKIRHLDITPETKVRIHGEIEVKYRPFKKIEIDVSYLEIQNSSQGAGK